MDIKELLAYEKSVYRDEVLLSNSITTAWLKNEPQYRIWKWQKYSRLTDYFRRKMNNSNNIAKFISSMLYLYFIRKKQKLGEKLGLEVSTENIGKGLIIYHYNNVINACSQIGCNCHIHGTVVIGNDGVTNKAPVIGNNVMVGAGAKVIGDIIIADNIKIAAGAVVVHSFTEPGITIAGVPARKVSK